VHLHSIGKTYGQIPKGIALPDICTVDTYAAHVGLHPSTVRGHLRQGKIPGRRVGRRWLIARLALIAHLTRTESSRKGAT
jgi:excisionase family DNA binding protein